MSRRPRAAPLLHRACLTLSLLVAWVAPATAAAPSEVDWPLHGLGPDNARHSPLDQIDRGNVGRLELRWRVATGMQGSFQATPIVVDGRMYVSTPWNDVLALDAATGRTLWRHRHDPRTRTPCCGPANRGVAVADGLVWQATVDNRLLALDAASGALRFDLAVTNDDPAVREALAPLLGDQAFADATVTGGTGYGLNMAPQVFDGKVYAGVSGTGYGLHVDRAGGGAAAMTVVGFSGGAHGLRGFIAAWDARDGRELWRWYSVPGPEWTGRWTATTPDGEDLGRDLAGERAAVPRWPAAWRLGGGSIWSTPAIDPATRTLYFGTGNPAPQMDDATRPGDNLHTSSLVALDADTGTLRWAVQLVPHDRWGYDVASPPVLLEVEEDGRPVPAVAVAAKTGRLYVLDRRDGRLIRRSVPFVPQQNLYARPDAQGVTIAPAILGGASWSPPAFDAGRGLFFVEGIHHPATYRRQPLAPSEGRPWTSYTWVELAPTGRAGNVSAIEVATGALRWQRPMPAPMVGGLLATAGGLVFAGEGDGTFLALDADTGATLWQWQAAAGVNAPPVTWQTDGVQYVAVAAGGNSLFGFTTGDEILCFALAPEGAPPAVDPAP